METNVSTNDKRANSIIKNSVPHAQVIQQNSQHHPTHTMLSKHTGT
jgi:hypothetical protein